ncbi:MAG: hypothetical protein IK128_00815 [Clostridiales bacterium]|nr:hypothetical protein [Clostridiales bacterium]
MEDLHDMKTGKRGQTSGRTVILLAVLGAAALGAMLFIGFARFDLAHKFELISYTKISSAEDLASMRDDPNGNYVLTSDIDMSGVEWEPFAFSGILDGDGHSINNLKITAEGSSKRDTYDGNMKVYETSFSGLFDVMENAEVRNLSFRGADVEINSDSPVFVGIIAGYMSDSIIVNCTVEGTVYLRAHDRMFGVGGVIGYGCGVIQNVDADVTLICVDTDSETKDEQFMGGICAAGYPDLTSCTVDIDGYGSEHGYAHNGGIIGMFRFYPEGTDHDGKITDNTVYGMITFFEDNDDRRAYCDPIVGECMEELTYWYGNSQAFTVNEVFEYDVELLPED